MTALSIIHDAHATERDSHPVPRAMRQEGVQRVVYEALVRATAAWLVRCWRRSARARVLGTVQRPRPRCPSVSVARGNEPAYTI